MDSDEFETYKTTEDELTLYYISCMVETLLEQLLWLKVVVEEALKREEEKR
jgi:hypothetical protein